MTEIVQNLLLWFGSVLALVLGSWLALTEKTLTLPARDSSLQLGDDIRGGMTGLFGIAVLKMIGLKQGKPLTVWHKKIFGIILIFLGLWLINVLYKAHIFF